MIVETARFPLTLALPARTARQLGEHTHHTLVPNPALRVVYASRSCTRVLHGTLPEKWGGFGTASEKAGTLNEYDIGDATRTRALFGPAFCFCVLEKHCCDSSNRAKGRGECLRFHRGSVHTSHRRSVRASPRSNSRDLFFWFGAVPT